MEFLGNLLIVEDEPLLRRLVSQFLSKRGYLIVEACDGIEAIDHFTNAGPFDLVLCDLNLPGYDGVEVCRRIREVTPDQPIIICSAAILPKYEQGLNALGIYHHLTKPYDPEFLLNRILVEIQPPPTGPLASHSPFG